MVTTVLDPIDSDPQDFGLLQLDFFMGAVARGNGPVPRQNLRAPAEWMTWRQLDTVCLDKMLDMIFVIVTSLRHLLGWVVSAFRSREDLILENLALRQQLLALHAKRPRHRLTTLHKLFWIALKTFWSGWTKPLVLVTPQPSCAGIGPASGCIGLGFQEPDEWEDEDG